MLLDAMISNEASDLSSQSEILSMSNTLISALASTPFMRNASSRKASISMSLISKQPIASVLSELASNLSSRKVFIFGSSEAAPRRSLRKIVKGDNNGIKGHCQCVP